MLQESRRRSVHTHSLTHSLTHSFATQYTPLHYLLHHSHSLTYSLTHALTHSRTHTVYTTSLLTPSLSLTYSLTYSLTQTFATPMPRSTTSSHSPLTYYTTSATRHSSTSGYAITVRTSSNISSSVHVQYHTASTLLHYTLNHSLLYLLLLLHVA
jgi:hypothetical protein